MAAGSLQRLPPQTRRGSILQLPTLGLAAAAVLAGCAVGPDYKPPAAPSVDRYTEAPLPPTTVSADTAGGAAQHFDPGADILGDWWSVFHSKALNARVAAAIAANPTIDAATAALRQAREVVKAQQGAFFPTVQGNFMPQRYKNAVEPSPTLATYEPYFNLYDAQVTVSYGLDIWGANRRQLEALEAQAEDQRFQYEAAYLALTANVVTASVQEALLRAEIAATDAIIEAESQSLDLLRTQRRLGQVGGVDVAAQEAALAQAQASLPPLHKQLAQQRDLLAALAGRLPSDQPGPPIDLAAFDLPQDVPVSLPSKLVAQRPDVRSAEAQLHAASAGVGVAIANMLPAVTLSATDGTTATKLSQLFLPGNGFWTLTGSVTQTVFDGGTLLHKRRAADAALDQAAAQYRSTVLGAFQNVGDSLEALESDADAVKAALAAERAAAASLSYARRQLELGSISDLGLLNAEQTDQQAVLNLVQAKASRIADTAALFAALGGGWWNRADATAEGGMTPAAPKAESGPPG